MFVVRRWKTRPGALLADYSAELERPRQTKAKYPLPLMLAPGAIRRGHRVSAMVPYEPDGVARPSMNNGPLGFKPFDSPLVPYRHPLHSREYCESFTYRPLRSDFRSTQQTTYEPGGSLSDRVLPRKMRRHFDLSVLFVNCR